MAFTERSNLIKSLCPGDESTAKQRAINNQRLPGTCQWFLDHETTQSWLYGNDNPVLWLHGRSATGKTFLSSSLVNYVQNNQSRPARVAVAAYHFSRDHVQYNLADYGHALQSTLRQLLSQLPVSSNVLQDFLTNTERPLHWRNNFHDMLKNITSEFDKFLIILDGVDAATESGLQDLMKTLFGNDMHALPLRILITSRASPPDIFKAHDLGVSLIEAHANRMDLGLYIAKAIDESPVNPEYLDESHTKLFPYQKLFDMSNGLFLPLLPVWFTNIGSQPNKVLLNLVESWSAGSDTDVVRAFCSAVINEIQSAKHADMIFCVLYHLVMIEKTPYSFTLPMAYEALDTWGIKQENTSNYTTLEISEACASLIFLDTKDQAMSIRSPLLVTYLRLEVFGDDHRARDITASLRYLSKDDFTQGACNSSKELKERLKTHRYLWYAASRLSLNLARTVPESFMSDFIRLTTSRGSIESYQQAAEAWQYVDEESYDELENDAERWYCFTRGYSPLHLAAHLGTNETMIQTLVDRGEDLEYCAKNGQTPLHVAAEIEDYPNTLQRLLERGSNVAAVDNDGLTPLSIAIVHGDLDSVKLLLDHGARIDTLDEEDLLECSREKPAIAQFLVDLGVEMPTHDSE
ncbi:hypothetical protein FSARC_11621 [Fusarium sarcochroum]|uniref:Nephrocystin 3-like N-terminal domain-containing protein n=1 Tax=Fusarium sarcochroum TaxID=1208366 RepID=A0A8H4TE44_9HYPO|nr:hypothetical protein FSARC_11621 [Fusarium sarcochroum]